MIQMKKQNESKTEERRTPRGNKERKTWKPIKKKLCISLYTKTKPKGQFIKTKKGMGPRLNLGTKEKENSILSVKKTNFFFWYFNSHSNYITCRYQNI